MVELIILSALGVITFFSGLISLGNQEVFMGALTFLVLLVSYVLIVLVYRKKKKLKLSVWLFSLSGCFLKELKLWVVL